jgi:hypothetical protein
LTVIEREPSRWLVATPELWLMDAHSKPAENEDVVVLAADYDALAEQLAGAVEALELVGLALGPDASIMPDPRVREASRIVREALAAIGGGRRVTEEATG